MEKRVRFEYSHAEKFIDMKELIKYKEPVLNARDMLISRNGIGSEFTGWVDLPVRYEKEELQKIKNAADKIISDSEVLIVVGIGGSYLGARAAIEFLRHNFYNIVDKNVRKTPEIYFVGNNISSTYMGYLMRVIENKEFSVNVISKSGTTTEPAVAFRIFKNLLEERYGEEAKDRIYATTDKEKGVLKNLADIKGYQTFVIPDDVGGRYSVLTPVGLLPIAACGADIEKLLKGAAEERERVINNDFEENGALQYAAIRNLFMKNGKCIEIIANYEPSMHFMGEWWKQLYGESEGKENKGLFPASVDLTSDLHSMGQYIQEGVRNMFETVLEIEMPKLDIKIQEDKENLDELNFLAGRTLDYVNKCAMKGTMLAHTDGGVPNLLVKIPSQTEEYLGQLFYFFEFACAVSGYVLGVNPFDQPGVELYKNNMFALLAKPGYEAEEEEIYSRL